jgi:hypothetical protein
MKEEITRVEDYGPAPSGGEHKVKLPSGAVFLLRYPSLEYKIGRSLIAQSIAAKMQNRPEAQPSETRSAAEIAETYFAVLEEVCVQPRVSKQPKEGELHPDRIRLSDAVHIMRWASGEVDDNGVDFAAFRGTRADPASISGPGGEAVRAVAEQPSENVAG